jgi:murein DD-endopeptidase MepM/ murein hydrolase activator NlpD
VLLALLLLLLVAGIAAAPRAIRIRLSARDYRAGVALRQELGDRLQALLARLELLARRAAALRERTARIERIYGIAAHAGETARPEAPRATTSEPAPTIFAAQIASGNRTERELAHDLEAIGAAIARIADFEGRHPVAAAELPVGAPLSGENVVLAGGFGPRRSPYTQEMEFHSGVDFAAPRGAAVVAPAAGVVVWAGTVTPQPGNEWWRLGRVVVLRHGAAFRTVFGHLDSIAVAPGKRVAAGDRLGTVGETGWTTAPNLHYEIRRESAGEWIAVDPIGYLLALPESERYAGAAARTPVDGLAPPPLPSQFKR